MYSLRRNVGIRNNVIIVENTRNIRPSVCLSVYLSGYLYVCMSVYLSVCLYIIPSVCLPACPSACLHVCLAAVSLHSSCLLPVARLICLSIFVINVYVCICMPIHISLLRQAMIHARLYANVVSARELKRRHNGADLSAKLNVFRTYFVLRRRSHLSYNYLAARKHPNKTNCITLSRSPLSK